jgi:hypothetical protein
MAKISVQFKNKINGYDKVQVQEYAKDKEARLQEKSIALANAQQKIEELEAKLTKITGADSTIEEKVELYDKLMKKMDGDYTNLLTPAIAKAKAIEADAEKEYAIRIDQAKYAAEGIYDKTADRIAEVVDANMDRLYELLDDFIYSKTLAGRIEQFVTDCKLVSAKIVAGVASAKQVPAKAVDKMKATYANLKEKIQTKIATYTAAEEIAEIELAEELSADAE